MRVGSGVQTDATALNNIGTCRASWERYNPLVIVDTTAVPALYIVFLMVGELL